MHGTVGGEGKMQDVEYDKVWSGLKRYSNFDPTINTSRKKYFNSYPTLDNVFIVTLLFEYLTVP